MHRNDNKSVQVLRKYFLIHHLQANKNTTYISNCQKQFDLKEYFIIKIIILQFNLQFSKKLLFFILICYLCH